jgi:hypothetical protein
MSGLFNRPGRIEISDELLSEPEAREAIGKIFSNFLPVRAEHDYMRNVLMYWGYSELFDEAECGIEPPMYIANVSLEGDVSFSKGDNK